MNLKQLVLLIFEAHKVMQISILLYYAFFCTMLNSLNMFNIPLKLRMQTTATSRILSPNSLVSDTEYSQ